MPILSARREELVDLLCEQQIHINPDLCSLVDSGDTGHEIALKEFARLCLENVEEKMTEYSTSYVSAWTQESRSIEHLKNHSFYTERYSMQSFRDRMTLLSTEEDNVLSDVVLPFGIHRHVLRSCHLDLVDDLDLIGTTLLDELVERHLMEDSDVRSIIEVKEKKARTEVFLSRIQVMFSAESFVKDFIPVLSKYNPDVVPKMSLFLYETPFRPDSSKCFTCQIKAFVQPRLLADVLFSNGVIDANLHQDLREHGISNQEKWETLLTKVKDDRDILEALKMRCPSVYEEFDLANVQSFECWCHLIISQPALPTCDDTPETVMSDVANIDDLASVLLEDEDTDFSGQRPVDESSVFEDSLIFCEMGTEETHVKQQYSVDRDNAENINKATKDELHMKKEGRSGTAEEKELLEQEGVNEELNTGGKYEVIYSREASESPIPPPKRSFGTSIKSFLNRQLYSIRLLASRRRTNRPAMDEKAYDFEAHIIYDETDAAFMFMVDTELEAKFGIKLHLDYRDDLHGDSKIRNIERAIVGSRKSVILLSPAFVASDWCRFQYDLATYETLDTGKKPPILVLYKFVDVNSIPRSMVWRLRNEKYHDYATTNGDATFWYDLAQAIRE